MTLSTGTKLSHYEITSQIGKGGMGEVYKATDTKLGREVAIKVLPEEFAKDADRITRFQREAKLLASLNHPNIAAIHGLEEDNGIHFLVLELVEGQTLAERIISSPIEVEEALKLGLQIAEALEAAHEKGVIHRDLKPANIKVTPEGKVKVLDFGLAKAYAGEQDQMNLSNSPTLSDMATQQGLILGTAAYMSPEQARGKPVDKRTDVWAFGCVLYEMLTGKAAFQGEDVTEILAAVVKSGVNMDLLPANIHPRIVEVISRCLQKDQKKRYEGIGDVQYEIERVLGDPGGVFVQPSIITKPKKKLRVSIPWVAAAVALTAVIIGVVVWLFKPAPPPEPKQVIRSEYVLPEDQHFFRRPLIGGFALAVSSDGSQFAYSTTKGIYIHSMKELDARLVSGTDKDASSIFFSPDGQWIGYFSVADQKLKSISINGGTPTDLCDASLVFNATWYEDNTIVYSDLISGIYRIPAKRGTPELLAERSMTGFPSLLPDGKSLMFVDANSRPYKTIVQSLDTREQAAVFDYEFGRYLPTGHFVYWAEGSLFAVPFDLDNLEFTGGAASIIEAQVDSAISNSGTLVYVPGSSRDVSSTEFPKRTLVWVYKDGREEPLAVEPQSFSNPRISPDGKLIAITIQNSVGSNIWVFDTVRETLTPVTFDVEFARVPLWKLDSKQVVFVLARNTALGVYSMAANGTGELERIASSNCTLYPRSWADNENVLVGLTNDLRSSTDDIYTLTVEGDAECKPLLASKYNETHPILSPDEKWIAYSSDETGRYEVWVRSYPNLNNYKKQFSTDGGYNPLWSPDGQNLYYRNGNAVMEVVFEAESTLMSNKPKELFPDIYFAKDYPNMTDWFPWDIHPDGKRFLMQKPSAVTGGESSGEDTATEEPRKIIVVTNWFEELKDIVHVD